MLPIIELIGGGRAAVLAAAALAGWATAGYYRLAHDSLRVEAAEQRQAAAEAAERALNEAVQIERGKLAEVETLAARYADEKRQAEIAADRTIADLRSGALRLRRRLAAQACPAGDMSADADTASGSHVAEVTGLRAEDAEFLVRESQRADSVVRQLTACQSVLRIR